MIEEAVMVMIKLGEEVGLSLNLLIIIIRERDEKLKHVRAREQIQKYVPVPR